MIRSIHRIGVIVTLLIAVALASAGAQTAGVVEKKLDNGLTVLMKEAHAAPVFTAQLWFKVGSRNEHVGITGISHLLEHMLFNSSKNYKKGEITRMVRERGGIDNAATWTDFTYYWELLSSEHLDFALKTLAERMGNTLLLDEEFQKERTVVLSELQGHENEPDRVLYEAVTAASITAHPYHWPTIGYESDVENVGREQLVAYYRAYYHPNNATLVLVGDFDQAKALPLIEKYFGKIPSRPLPKPVYTREPEQRGERRLEVRREGNAERVIMAYHCPELVHPDSYPLIVLDQILSGGRSSRLYQALVMKGLATSAWSSAGGRKDPSLFMLGATARQGVTAEELEKALREQVEIARTTLPTDAEMQAAKNQLEAYFVFQNDSVSDQGEQLGFYNTIASWRYLETVIPKVKAVTPEQVKAVAEKYFAPEKVTVGTFVPTAPAPAGEGAGPVGGPVHYSDGDPSQVAKPQGATVQRTQGTAKPASGVRPHVETLDNGMVVIVQENHSNPTVAISGNLKAGSYFDPAGKDRLASVTAEMISRGTQKRSALEIARESEYVGASIDASADVESASFSAKSLSKDLPLMLDLLSDQLRNASFPQDQLDRTKGEFDSRLAQSQESPDARADRAFYGAVFPEGHPYHKLPVEESRKQLQSITREDVVAFHNKYYRPDTAIIVIAGDVDARSAVGLVKQYFGDWKAEGPAPVVEIPTVEPAAASRQIVIPMMDKSEVSVVYGHAMGLKRSDPDFYAARIMNQILGGAGALASILGEQIREKQGLVYNVYSQFDASLGAGPWYVQLGTNPKNADKAVSLVRDEVSKFKKNGATQKDFQQAREFVIGVFPIALETNEGMARMLLSAQFYGLGTDYLRNYAKIYRSVTLEQVNAAAKKYLRPESATLVIAGPYQGE